MPRFYSAIPRHRCDFKSLIRVLSLLAVLTGLGNPGAVQGQTAAAGDIVFSQVYTRGGNPGSTYKNNFIELFNRSNAAVDVSGWPIYIASDTGTFSTAIAFSSSRGLIIQPGGYLLIEFETAGSNGAPLPVFPDLSVPQFGQFPISLPPSGKLAFSKPNSGISGQCPLSNPSLMDLIGYGITTNCFEGTGPTATLSNTTAAIRHAAGCTDTNNNASDFTVSHPNPRNSFSAKHFCSTNQIDDADFFVRQHYSDFLNRIPDDPGLVFWRNQITSCGGNQACIELKRVNVSAAFFLSIEFQETGYLTYRLYKAAYGDANGVSTFGGTTHQLPVPIIRFQEFLSDSQQIRSGCDRRAGGLAAGIGKQ